MRRRARGVVTVSSGLAALLFGWAAFTAPGWNGPCQPRFPGAAGALKALPAYACFTVDGDAATGYTVNLSYSDQEHDPEENLKLAYDEVKVFWDRFPYPVSEFDIDTTAAFGEAAIEQMRLSDDVVKHKLGGRPASLRVHSAFPAQPAGRTQIALWTLSGLALLLTAVLYGRAVLSRRRGVMPPSPERR